MSDAKKEIEELKQEVAALKTALSGKEDKPPPKKEFVEQPYQRYDPTAGMSMPPSALQAMVAAVPDRMLRDIVHDNRNAPTSPISTIPKSQQESDKPAPLPNPTFWGHR